LVEDAVTNLLGTRAIPHSMKKERTSPHSLQFSSVKLPKLNQEPLLNTEFEFSLTCRIGIPKQEGSPHLRNGAGVYEFLLRFVMERSDWAA